MSIVAVSIPFPYNVSLYFLEGQKHEDSKLGIMINVGKCRPVKVFFSIIHKTVMHVQRVLVDTSWLHNVWEIVLLFINSGFSGKIKNAFLILFQNLLTPPPFKKEGRDYAFYMREYKVETIKLLPFYMTDFLFAEL